MKYSHDSERGWRIKTKLNGWKYNVGMVILNPSLQSTTSPSWSLAGLYMIRLPRLLYTDIVKTGIQKNFCCSLSVYFYGSILKNYKTVGNCFWGFETEFAGKALRAVPRLSSKNADFVQVVADRGYTTRQSLSPTRRVETRSPL